jgi:predicted AAA+ superfamily ATPase
MVNTSTLISIFENISFNSKKSQAKTLYESENFIENVFDYRVFIFIDSAGTGKSTLTKAIVNYLNLLELPVQLLPLMLKQAKFLVQSLVWKRKPFTSWLTTLNHWKMVG